MIGHNTAKIELPPRIKVHPIFNMALLKKYYSQCLMPNPIWVDNDTEYKVEEMLKHHRHPAIISTC